MIIEEFRNDLLTLVTGLVKEIDDDYRSASQEPGDETPSMDLTVATDGEAWGYQTGDNSYSGACYFFPHWAVTTLYRDSDPQEVVKEIYSQWNELTWDSDMNVDNLITNYVAAREEANRLEKELIDHVLPVVQKLINCGLVKEAEEYARDVIPDSVCRVYAFDAVKQAKADSGHW